MDTKQKARRLEMNDDLREAILQLIAETLTIDVVTKSEYTGGMDGSGCLYKDTYQLQILLEGEVISEAYLS